MADVATPGKKKAARKPAREPSPPVKKPEADDGGLRDDDRARLKKLVEQRRKKEAAERRAEKQADASIPPGNATAVKQPNRSTATPQATRKSSDKAKPETPAPATSEMAQGGRLRRLHELLLDRLGHNPERVPTAAKGAAGREPEEIDRVSPRKVINWALDLLPDEPKGYTLIDIGCGRGRVILEAARRPFHRIIGIERDLALYEDAMLNLRHWPRSIMACRDVDIIHGNAATWKLPPGDLVFYLFDPFDERAMLNLVTRLNRHVEGGNTVAVIYLDPSFSLPLRESPYFGQVMPVGMLRRKIETFSPYRLEIYSSSKPG